MAAPAPPPHDWLAGGNRRDVALERILSVATEIALERGLGALAPDAVAARAGCSRATLYRYVGGKAALRDGVVGRAARTIVATVHRAVANSSGPERVVEAITASVAAVRADPVAMAVVGQARSGDIDRYFSVSAYMAETAADLSGFGTDRAAAQWIVRVVLSILVWPGDDPQSERAMIGRFVAPAFG